MLVGIVLSVATFWLFAQTANINGPLIRADLGLGESTLSAGIAAAGVACGMFIAVAGSVADRNGHVRMVIAGNITSIIGSLLVAVVPAGTLAVPLFLGGRVLQGIAAGLIMPATLTMIQRYWEGKDRQRAISMWSLGSFGAAGLAPVLGGLLGETFIGWRGIFIISAVVSVIGIVLVRRAPETETPRSGLRGLDLPGAATFALGTALLFVLVTQVSKLDWSSATPWVLLAATIIVFAVFAVIERKKGSDAFLDFALFRNRQYSSVAVANFLINAVGGGLIVSLWVLQTGYGLGSGKVGLLTLGFAAAVILCLRVGEKLIGKMGARPPMIIAAALVVVALLVLMSTFLPLQLFIIATIVGCVVLGIGMAIFATPATDAALSALPKDQLGVGSGFYKMASALGNGFGIAVATAIFGSQETGGAIAQWVGTVLPFSSDGDVLVRQAGAVAMGGSLLIAVAALLVISLWIPKNTVSSLDEKPTAAASPKK